MLKGLRIVSGILFAAIVALGILQVFFRSVLGSPLTWSEELSRLLLVWMTFLAAAVVTYDGTHLRVDTFFLRLSPVARRRVRTLNTILALAVLVLIAIYSLPILQLSAFGRTGTLGVPFAYFRAPATVGASLMVALLLLRVRRRVTSSSRPTGAPDDVAQTM